MSTPTITLYGIPNCDTVKKARAWLAGAGAWHQFHDFKKQGVPADRLDAWLRATGWETLVNRKGTTWRKLEPAVQAGRDRRRQRPRADAGAAQRHQAPGGGMGQEDHGRL
jgi:arsenate reductase-like glutaredoxin family protein